MWKERLQESLRRLREDDPAGIAPSHPTSWQASLLQERRYSRIFVVQPQEAAARLALQDRLESDAIILKLYHAVQAARRQQEYDDLEQVQRLCGTELQGTVVRPVAVYADLGAVMTVRATGEPVAPLMQQACRRRASVSQVAESAALSARAGSWLLAFQQAQPQPRGVRSPHLSTVDDFVTYVEARLARMQQRPFRVDAPLLTRTRQALRQSLADDAILQSVTWSHSDFGPHNLLADDRRLTVLDFELMPQHPWFDAAYFVESLAGYRGPRYSAAHVERMQRAFLNSYGLTGDEALFVALRIRHLVCTAASLRAHRALRGLRHWPDHWMLRMHLDRLVQQLEAAKASQVRPPQVA